MAEGTFSEKELQQALDAYGLKVDCFRLLKKGQYGEAYRAMKELEVSESLAQTR